MYQLIIKLHRAFSLGFYLLMAVSLAVPFAAAESPRPNIVVFLSDDQAWGDLSISGNTNLHTPNVDSIAKAGASLEHFYVCPVCAPTRAEFLTGRYHLRVGVNGVSTGRERLNTDEKTIADAFKAAGYTTGCFGKWHNGGQWPYHPNARGFDEFYGFTCGHWGEYFDPPLDHNGQPVRGKGYIADDFTDYALAFIEKNKTQPFFCYLPFNTPHSPLAVPQKYWKKFKDKPITQRANSGDPENLDETRCVLAMSENIDWNVGRVLRKLDELKLANHTIVIYFSDNGPNTFRWNGGMKGRKGSTDEGGVRVPFFIRWPGRIRPGTVVSQIAGAIDLLPTLTAMAEIPRVGDKPLDGINISSLLTDGADKWPDREIFSHWNGKFSVRTQRYRLDSKGALFDLLSDPGQHRDIAAEKPETASKLLKAVADWRREMSNSGTKTKAGDRPYPVGYTVFPRTTLPSDDAIPHGGVRRSAIFPNCSYFVNWTSLDDSITWDIQTVTTGDYAVDIFYTCPEADAGSKIELGFNGSKLAGQVAPGFDPPLYTNQDTLPRRESQMKEFRPLHLGTMHLAKGRGLLTLRALDIPGKNVMDVRQITLTLLKPRP